MDRTSRDFDVLATANGGTEVEEIAKAHPESVKRLHINALDTFDLDAATEMARNIGFYHADVDQAARILLNMWQCFKTNDATLVEINPLAKIGDPQDESSKSLCALDAKISLDDNASYRHDGWKRFEGATQLDPYERKAKALGPQVRSVFVNVYGGITSCQQVAAGILGALQAIETVKPIVVRFDGNAAQEGLRMLADANDPNLHVYDTMEEAAQQAARIAAASSSKEATK